MFRVAKGFALVVATVLAACGGGREALRSNATVDLSQHMGRWYVIAHIPYFAERGKVAARDEYALRPDGRIDNVYVYRKSFDSPEKRMRGIARVIPGTRNAQWKIRFFGVISANYLILETAPDYSWALIGYPNRKLAWIFARTPTLDASLYESLRERFRHYGYDPQQLLRVPQLPEQVGQPGFAPS